MTDDIESLVVKMPSGLIEILEELADEENVSIDDYIMSALTAIWLQTGDVIETADGTYEQA